MHAGSCIDPEAPITVRRTRRIGQRFGKGESGWTSETTESGPERTYSKGRSSAFAMRMTIAGRRMSAPTADRRSASHTSAAGSASQTTRRNTAASRFGCACSRRSRRLRRSALCFRSPRRLSTNGMQWC